MRVDKVAHLAMVRHATMVSVSMAVEVLVVGPLDVALHGTMVMVLLVVA
jgi:hypothetical protein